MTRDTNTTAGAVGLPRPGGNGALATQGGSSSHGGGTSILDLPDDIVGPILRTLCVSEDEESAGAGDADGSDGAGSVSMERAGAYSSVCRRWRAILRCSYARLALRGHELVDAGAVLHELRACRNVTCVRLVGARGSPAAEEGEGGEDWRRLLRGLADPCECPALVSLQLHFYNAREALPDLAEFLAARTTLQRLQLRVEDYQVAPPGESADKSEGEADHEDGSEDEGGSNDGADCAGHALGLGLAAWQAYHASLRTLDFGHLASLEALTLDYKDLYFPDGEDGAASWHHDLPVSKSVAALPALTELTLRAPGRAALPAWLGELPAFSLLALWCNSEDPRTRLVCSLGAPARFVQDLSLYCSYMQLGPAEFDAIAGLPLLARLRLECHRVQPSASMARAVFAARLERLELGVNALSSMEEPMPRLRHLALIVDGQAGCQRNLFELTSGLHCLHLNLGEAPAWPSLAPLRELTSLTVGRFGRPTLDVGPLQALRRLELTSCHLLTCMAGLFGLGSGVQVELHCRCHGLQRFKSHAEYVAATPQPPCRHLTPGNARRLFHDTRAEAARSSTQRPASSSGWSFSRRFGAYVLASVRLCLPSTLASLLLVAIALAWAL